MAHVKEANRLRYLKLGSSEKEFLTDCLIGDGTLSQAGKNYRLRVNHSVKHSDYVYWKYKNLKRFCISEPQYVTMTRSLRFGTVGHPEITALRQKWYPNGTKEVPSDFHLSPLALAIWFMDDGCRQGKSVDFSVHCFSAGSIERLKIELLLLGIDSTLLFDGKGYRILYKTTLLSNI